MKISESEFYILQNKLEDFMNIKVLTPSMAPLININDIVKIKKIDPNKIQPYDIIVFWQKNKLFCHFFIKKEGDFYIARGLNNKEYDDKIEEKYLFGQVLKPEVGKVKKFFLRFLLR